ncbi:MAG TPA: HTTM domain-containing protein [Chthoniobacterales bacterium]|nr:HTTM domain-containing protein [Chthoniobacterales bacterium]
MTRRGFQAFLFPPETDSWLTILRVGLGLQVVFFCGSLFRDWNQILARTGNGVISRDLAETLVSLESPCIPNVSWLTNMGMVVGLTEHTTISLVWVLLCGFGVLLIIGLFTRLSAIGAWFIYLCVVKSSDLLVYGVDNLTTIGLFYLMISPLPGSQSLDHLRWRKKSRDPELLGFFRRVLQLHLCFVYFFGGLAKCLGAGWWDGSSLWRSLIRPPFNVIDPNILVHWKSLFPVGGMVICLLEVTYPIFIWPNRTRLVWLTGILLMHFSIAILMGMYLFAAIMIVLNVAAFGPGSLRRQPAARCVV